jgi:hypothetical protein
MRVRVSLERLDEIPTSDQAALLLVRAVLPYSAAQFDVRLMDWTDELGDRGRSVERPEGDDQP